MLGLGLKGQYTFNPHYLLLALTLIFYLLVTPIVSYISAKGYLANGSLMLLFVSLAFFVGYSFLHCYRSRRFFSRLNGDFGSVRIACILGVSVFRCSSRLIWVCASWVRAQKTKIDVSILRCFDRKHINQSLCLFRCLPNLFCTKCRRHSNRRICLRRDYHFLPIGQFALSEALLTI